MPFALNLQQFLLSVAIRQRRINCEAETKFLQRDRRVADFWHLRALKFGALMLILPHLGLAEQELADGFVRESKQNSAAAAGPALQSLTLEQAVKRVTRQSGGKILSARRIQTRKGPMFRIKVLTRTGRVRVVQIAEFEPPSVSK